MANQLENSDLIIQLPWTVPQQENNQAVILQQPNDQKLFLDIQHSTDWVVATSIFVSGMISFIGFLITIYVVRKSTESQIESNQELMRSQERLKQTEAEMDFRKRWISDVTIVLSNLQISVHKFDRAYNNFKLKVIKEKLKLTDLQIDDLYDTQNQILPARYELRSLLSINQINMLNDSLSKLIIISGTLIQQLPSLKSELEKPMRERSESLEDIQQLRTLMDDIVKQVNTSLGLEVKKLKGE